LGDVTWVAVPTVNPDPVISEFAAGTDSPTMFGAFVGTVNGAVGGVKFVPRGYTTEFETRSSSIDPMNVLPWDGEFSSYPM
jgi:hypothetical protein